MTNFCFSNSCSCKSQYQCLGNFLLSLVYRINIRCSCVSDIFLIFIANTHKVMYKGGKHLSTWLEIRNWWFTQIINNESHKVYCYSWGKFGKWKKSIIERSFSLWPALNVKNIKILVLAVLCGFPLIK